MKSIRLIFAAVAMLAMTGFLFAGNGNEDEFSVTTCTYEELVQCYGENIVLMDNLQPGDITTLSITMLHGPCSAYPDFELCGPAQAAAANAARDYARLCCCDVIYGWECCDPSSGPISVLALMRAPGNCN